MLITVRTISLPNITFLILHIVQDEHYSGYEVGLLSLFWFGLHASVYEYIMTYVFNKSQPTFIVLLAK